MVGTSVTARRVTYMIAGQAVASRVQTFSPTAGNTLYRLYTDHLGSTITHSTMSGGTVAGANTYYLPYGSYRGTPPTQTLTDRDFTGQRENRELGLLYYQARFYVPSIGRFASADTIIPDPANPQSLNRYTYVRNSPLNRVDPTGHVDCTLLDGGVDTQACNTSKPKPFTSPYFNFTGDLTLAEKQMAHQAADDIAQRMAQEVGGLSAQETFLNVFGGPITLANVDKDLVDAGGFSVYAIASQTENLITIGKKEITNHYLLVHEIFHLLDIVVLGGDANQALLDVQSAPGSTFPNRPNLEEGSDLRWGFAGGNFSQWQKSRSGASGEEFADMGIGWTYGQWETNALGALTTAGQDRANFMSQHMSGWLLQAMGQ